MTRFDRQVPKNLGVSYGVHRVSPDDVRWPDAEPSSLPSALLEQAEDITEDLLYRSYAHVAPALGNAFSRLVEEGEKAIRVLEEIGRELGIPLDDGELSEADVDLDRIVWQPVARSSVLALLNYLVPKERVGVHDATKWAQEAISLIDRSEFQAETSLAGDDIDLALQIAAQELVRWEELQWPRSFYYHDEFITLLANSDGASVARIVNATQPIAFIPCSPDGLEMSQDEESVNFRLNAKSASVYPVSPMAAYRSGSKLLLGEVPEMNSSIGLATVVMSPSEGCSFHPTDTAIEILSNEMVSLSIPRSIIASLTERGLLLERNPIDHVDGLSGSEWNKGAVAVSKDDSGDAECLALFVQDEPIAGE